MTTGGLISSGLSKFLSADDLTYFLTQSFSALLDGSRKKLVDALLDESLILSNWDRPFS